uniref:Ig-like domain-containing protein n=1 Tax=Pelusios castaneus TaxID=367368 RepID=A0A8C8RFN6_9SAUR
RTHKIIPVAKIYANSVMQPNGTISVHEGKPVLLHCTYDYSGSPILFWYEQYPDEAPRLLLTQYKALDEAEKRRRRSFSAKLEKNSKSFHLEKNSTEMSDSAVYHCALSDTVSKVSGGAVQKPTDCQAQRTEIPETLGVSRIQSVISLP